MHPVWRVGLVGAFGVIGVVATSSCSLLVPLDDYGSGSPPSDSPSAACSKPCGAGESCVDGRCIPGCSERVVFVNGVSGSDTNGGCAPDAALKTIGAALGLVTTSALANHEIRVCAGVYREPALRVTHPVSIRGGYNCQTWTRDPGFGKKGGFKSTNVTRIENGDFDAKPETLYVAGERLTRDVVIEGLTIAGMPEGEKAGIGLGIYEGASPTLRDVQVLGGATRAPATNLAGSIGVLVHTGASPEIVDSTIHGGRGSSNIGSVGISLSTAGLDLHDSLVNGGDGSTSSGAGWGIGAVAVHLGGASKGISIRNNELRNDGGTTSTLGAWAAFAVVVGSDGVELVGNDIKGGPATCGNGVTCSSGGIVVTDATGARIVGNRIDAGDLTPQGFLAGISVNRSKQTTLSGNLVHGGGAISSSTVQQYGIFVDGAPDTRVAGNTIVLAAGKSGDVRVGLHLSSNTSAKITGNLFLGSLGTSSKAGFDCGVFLYSCSGASMEELRSNAFIDVERTMYVKTGACAAPTETEYTSPSDAETALGAGVASNNVAVRPSCTGPSCAGSCTDAVTCPALVFASYDASTGGRSHVFAANGYALKPTGPCRINQGGVAPLADFPSDIYGIPRSTPYSIGAAEQDAIACSP